MCQSSVNPPSPSPNPGQKSTEFWLTAGTILVVMIITTILFMVDKINQDNWVKVIIYVSGIMGPTYATSRTVVKAFGPKVGP